MGTVAERWKIEAVLALVRQVEACDFFVAGEYNPSSKTRAFMRLVEFDYRDVRRIMRGLEVEDYCEGPLSVRSLCGAIRNIYKICDLRYSGNGEIDLRFVP